MVIHSLAKYAVRFPVPRMLSLTLLQTPSAAGAPRIRPTAKRSLDDEEDIEGAPIVKVDEEVAEPDRESTLSLALSCPLILVISRGYLRWCIL
jgi:hypothetical protein